jgi:hypothetical protein
MSTEFSQLGLDGEQQLGINPGSSDRGQQMGINPCPLSSPITPNGGQQPGINPGSPDGGQQMGINPCPYTMEDDKWEPTHVHQTHFIRSMQPQNSGQKMGQDLQNLLVLGSNNHKRVWPQHGRQQVGINPHLLGSLNQKKV